MRARNGLTGRWEGPEVIGGSFFELKVAGPSMLGIGRPDRHALPHATSLKFALTVTRAPSRASGFVLPPTAAGLRTIQDGPPSTQSGPSGSPAAMPAHAPISAVGGCRLCLGRSRKQIQFGAARHRSVPGAFCPTFNYNRAAGLHALRSAPAVHAAQYSRHRQPADRPGRPPDAVDFPR